MVFGLFEGSIEIALKKYNFGFGETIEGTANLKLSKEKKARRVVVTVLAEKKVTRYDSKGSHTSTETLFSQEAVLDGEKTYTPPGASYDFKIQLPPQGFQSAPSMNGALGTAVKAAQFFASSSFASQVYWFVEAKLDVPMGIDIGKKVQITVQ